MSRRVPLAPLALVSCFLLACAPPAERPASPPDTAGTRGAASAATSPVDGVASAPASPARNAEARSGQPGASPAAPVTGDEAGRYGAAPEGAAPYESFHAPEKRFFVVPLEYKGAGREKEPPADVESVRIGLLAPLESERDGVYGRAIERGARLALDRANAEGGYRGLPFELVVRNDSGLWGASANEIVDFAYDDQVWAFLGTIDGANTHIALRVTLKAELPMVNVGSTDPTVTETQIPWLVRVMVDDRAQAYALATHVIRERGLHRVVAFRGNERYGRLGIVEFRDTARRMGHPLLLERNIPAGATDFDDEIALARRFEPDAIVLWLDPWEAARVLVAIRQRGWDVPVFGASRTVRPEFLALAGDAAEGFTAVTPYDPTLDDPSVRRFVEEYGKAYDAPPDAFAATAYDGVTLVVDAIRSAGLNRARIMDALNAVRSWHGAIGEGRLNAVQNAEGPLHLAVVRDGRFVYQEVR